MGTKEDRVSSVGGRKKHSWVWAKGVGIAKLAFWRKPWKQCVKCGAKLRMIPTGPRGGRGYSYQGPGDFGYRPVDTLPQCEPFSADYDTVTEEIKRVYDPGSSRESGCA